MTTSKKMTLLNHILYTLMLLCLCTMPIESRHRERDRKKHREPSSLASQHHIIETKIEPINLCSKERDMKLVCHCSPDNNEHVSAEKAECWIFRSDLSIRDPEWTAFHTQSQLQSLTFSVHGTGNLSFIPTSVIASLRHLGKLTIQFAQIHEIYGFAFGNFTRIHNISLPNNQIRVISAYAFANHQELHELNIQHNEIYEIDPFAFINLPNITRINLEHNRIASLHEYSFENLDKLSSLVLSHNNIDEILRESFKGLASLWTLKLDNNKLRYIGDGYFGELWSLIELDLSHNKIETITERAFDGLNNLKRLNLEHNQLSTLERGTFAMIPSLTYLNLMRNRLETVTLSTIQPLMNNLVNHTSMMLIKDNHFICDCRLTWLFDLKNRTRNLDLKYKLEEIECKKPKETKPSVDVGIENVQKIQSDYYDEEQLNNVEEKAFHLLQLKNTDLPCPQEYREMFDDPSTREFMSIGFDISHWISSTGSRSAGFSLWILILALISQFSCTFAAFLR